MSTEHVNESRVDRATRLTHHMTLIRDALGHGPPLTTDLLLATVARLSGAALLAHRSSIWLFDDTRELLVCRVMHIGGVAVTDQPTPASLSTRSCPHYIEALDAPAVAVRDALDDTRTSELRDYLLATKVGALLDIPILVPGGVMGVVCHEHVGGPRSWTEDEIEFAASIGALVAVALEAERRLGAERAARGSDARYRALVETLPVTVYVFDAKTGQLDYLSPSIVKLTGLDAAHWAVEHAVERWLELIELPYRDDVLRRLAHGSSEGLIEELVYPIRLASGRRWIRDTLGVVRDGVGRPVVVQGMFADVTAIHESERARAEAERRFRALLENSDLIAVLLDAQGNIEFVNDYGLRFLGHTRPEILGANWFHVTLQEPQRSRERERFTAQVAANNLAAHSQHTHTRAGGPPRLIAWANALLHDANGQPTGVARLGLDITDRIELETMQLQAQKNESLGRMAAGVAHDFNNLLTVMMSATEELVSGDAAHQADAHEAMNVAIAQGAELARALLDYGRKSAASPERLVLDALVKKTAPILARVVTGGLELVFDLEAGDAEIEVDVHQLRQVLVNLVANAVDAMREHGKRVRVMTRRLDAGEARALGLEDGREHVVLEVSDEGVGIDDATRARIFEPFFTTKMAGRGTGLGLALCDTIVRRAGGGIKVTSQPGHGATFSVYLPILSA